MIIWENYQFLWANNHCFHQLTCKAASKLFICWDVTPNTVAEYARKWWFWSLQHFQQHFSHIVTQSGQTHKTMLIFIVQLHRYYNMSRPMTKPTKWHMRPVKTQISLGSRPVWSASSLSTWRKLGSLTSHWAHSEDSDQTGRMDQLAVEIKIDEYWNPQLHALSIFSSPEPKAHNLSRRLTRWAYSIPMVRRLQHFQTWIPLKPVGLSWSNFMCSITHSFFIQSSPKLLVTWTGIKARSNSILGLIRPLISELLALEWWKFHSFELEYLRSQLANLNQILCVAYWGGGKAA